LLQHADNPVDWYPWGEEAFEHARQQDKPIFLSIGYAACHWCHVMEEESFKDDKTAALMNQHFINIKVDREERPDIDAIYMDAIVALTGHGGWPMSVFLTPEGKPFAGGTYFPPVRRHNLRSFSEILLAVAQAWREKRDALLTAGANLAANLARSPSLIPTEQSIDPSLPDLASQELMRTYDWTHGGWGGAPKFPQATTVEFLLRHQQRRGDVLARDMALHALRSMARGGIYDHLGGGFHRYAVDDRWQIPHFEKMLYDNALLIQAYLHGWQVTGQEDFRLIAETSLDFLLREMRHPQGGFYSSLDADTEGQEGKFYIWTLKEIKASLEDSAVSDLFFAAYGVRKQGNFEGANVLFRDEDDQALGEQFRMPAHEIRHKLGKARQALLAARAHRARPATDDKVLTAWNGLLLTTLAQAARSLGSGKWLQAAQDLASFLLANLHLDGRLMRSWRQGRARSVAFLQDHAALGLGLLELYQADFDIRWYHAALEQAEEILAHFTDPEGGFFQTRDYHEPLIARPKPIQDSPMPSGNTLAIWLLQHLTSFSGEDRFAEPAEATINAMQRNASLHPTAFSGWLCALDFALGPQLQLALSGDPTDPAFQALAASAHHRYTPGMVIAGGKPGLAGAPPLLSGRNTQHGKPTAYLCQAFTCNLPTNSPEELTRQVEQAYGRKQA
jgi:hypothetical protein